MTLRDRVQETLRYVQSKTTVKPTVAMILGSGLGELADQVEDATVLSFSSLPHFPVSTVQGHTGALVIGTLAGKKVAVMRGRVHYYEGYTMEQVTFPVRLLRELGCATLIVTNASGGIRTDLSPGDFVQISDHINMMGDNPLRGHNDPYWGPRFPDMTAVYDPELARHAHETAARVGVPLQRGVFCGLMGPSYETRAEIRMLATLGADMVGMSTVPEAIVAHHMGVRVLGISCVMNIVHGEVQPVTHDEVLEVAEKSRPQFLKLMTAVLQGLPTASGVR
ncbi:MAG TPA: purine-nucleoside phosphorylase [Candidatus Xenobia bacterium]